MAPVSLQICKDKLTFVWMSDCKFLLHFQWWNWNIRETGTSPGLPSSICNTPLSAVIIIGPFSISVLDYCFFNIAQIFLKKVTAEQDKATLRLEVIFTIWFLRKDHLLTWMDHSLFIIFFFFFSISVSLILQFHFLWWGREIWKKWIHINCLD